MVLSGPESGRLCFGSGRARTQPMTVRKKTARLSRETRKKLITVYNEELRAAGVGTFDDVQRVIAETSTASTINGALLAKIEEMLNRMSEPTPQELEKIMSELKGKLRYAIRPLMVQATLEFKKRLLRKPSSGRGASLNAEQKREACDQVAALIRKKVPYPQALMRVGQVFGVSARTIKRAW